MEFLNRVKEYVPGSQARKDKAAREFEERERAQERQRKHAEKALEASRQDIRELGHEFADALRETMGKGLQRKQLETSQSEFELAIARLTGIDAAIVQELVPNLYFLRLTEYLHRQEQNEDPAIKEALKEAYKPGLVGASMRERQAINKSMREVLKERGYDEEETHTILSKDRFYTRQEELDAAIQSLAQESPEAAHQFHGIEYDTLGQLVERIQTAFEHPSVAPHLKNSTDSVKFGVREITARALYDHAKRLQDLGEKTLTTYNVPSEYSTVAPLTIDEYVQEIESMLNNTTLLTQQAEYKKTHAETKVNELRNLDTLVSELTRYAEEGEAPVLEGPDEFSNWGWTEALKTYPPEVLRYAIRKFIQSIPQKDVQTMLRLRKDEIMKLLQTWAHGDEKNRAAFAGSFIQILYENLDRQWSGAIYGRDKVHFLQRDIQENLVLARQKAERPLAEFEKELRQHLEKIRQEKTALLDVMDDVEDLVNDPEILQDIQEMGERLDIKIWTERTVLSIQQSLENMRQKADDMEERIAYYAGNDKDEQRRLRRWLAEHPIHDVHKHQHQKVA
jgi:hypothetical protein